MFAIEIGTGENAKILPNPGEYKLTNLNGTIGYLICEDKGIAEAISNHGALSNDLINKKKS